MNAGLDFNLLETSEGGREGELGAPRCTSPPSLESMSKPPQDFASSTEALTYVPPSYYGRKGSRL